MFDHEPTPSIDKQLEDFNNFRKLEGNDTTDEEIIDLIKEGELIFRVVNGKALIQTAAHFYFFQSHRCPYCQSGALPCRENNWKHCSHPTARND